MPNQIHYEVFRRVGAKGGWTMQEVVSSRDAAIKLAQTMMAEEKATGVKVVKETYNEDTGDFLTLKIFEEGHGGSVAVPVAAEDAPNPIPCFKPDDLYSYHARATMTRLLVDFLARNKITVTELIHRADMLEKLEATGSAFQFAIQKIAVAQAAAGTTPVQQIVKSLNDLTTKACNRVYKDQRAGKFPDPLPEQFKLLAQNLAGQGDAPYLFNGALARHLKDCKGWDEKVHRLISIMEDAPNEEAPRKLVLSSIDAVLAEVLGGSSALRDLLGPAENLAEVLRRLVELFLGKPKPDMGQGLTSLTRHFAADDLPEARTAVANRIVAEFKANKRLCPESLVEELKALRSIANSIVMGIGKYLSHEDLIAAFTLRSERLVMSEVLSPYLEGATPDEKIERMLFVEDNIIGAKNKRTLATLTMPIITSAPFDNFFQDAKLPLVQRLQRLANLQGRIRRCGFIEETRAEMAEKLDRLALAVEARGKLFDSIKTRPTNHVEKATTLLKLATQGVFTEVTLANRARELILGYLSQPGFLAGYLAQLPRDEDHPPDSKQAMDVLMTDLNKAGITAETGLKSIAA